MKFHSKKQASQFLKQRGWQVMTRLLKKPEAEELICPCEWDAASFLCMQFDYKIMSSQLLPASGIG